MEDLEQLMKELDFDFKKKPKDKCKEQCGGTAVNMQRAKANCSLYDFLDMVATVVDYAMSDLNVQFISDEDENKIKDPAIALERPYISYRVIKRTPLNEYKPTTKEEVIEHDENNEQRPGELKSIGFKCLIQFNVFASENKVANQVMERFEELMLSYAGYYMEQGVRQVYFKEQNTDVDYNTFRDTLSVRNLIYYVEIEKMMVIFKRRISDALLKGNVVEDTENQINNKINP